MSKTKTPEPRIVVTMDTAARAEPAIAVATALARAYRRALHGLFIEDTDLLAVAGLPFAREIPRAGGEPRSLSNIALERQMARLAEQYRDAVERHAEAAAIPWTYASIRASKRRVMGEDATRTDLLVIGQPASSAKPRDPRILLLDGNRPPVLRALESVLQAPEHDAADLLVSGEFDAESLNQVLAGHPQVTRRLMGGPGLAELLITPGLRPSLVLLSRDADSAELEACLRLADCPVIVAGP